MICVLLRGDDGATPLDAVEVRWRWCLAGFRVREYPVMGGYNATIVSYDGSLKFKAIGRTPSDALGAATTIALNHLPGEESQLWRER
jgi:hypothetical protein